MTEKIAYVSFLHYLECMYGYAHAYKQTQTNK